MAMSHPREGLVYQDGFVSLDRKKTLLKELSLFQPIWENRFSENHPPPPGQQQRRLLRPVYWLGSWQFACLNYYHPPKGTLHRCLKAEPFPDEMQTMVNEIEAITRDHLRPVDIPKNWHLNTCLVNYYGSQILEDGKKNDVARVGEHRDYEPGPVASVSFGDRALFQFVSSQGKGAQSRVILQQWLDDRSLQIFGGDYFKKKLFHRVQRVERKKNEIFPIQTQGFETRRLNLTFRYVPLEHIYRLHDFPKSDQEDIKPYIKTLAKHSRYFSELSTFVL